MELIELVNKFSAAGLFQKQYYTCFLLVFTQRKTGNFTCKSKYFFPK
jgi:hypothetical protein